MTFRQLFHFVTISISIVACSLLSIVAFAKVFNIETSMLVSLEALIGWIFLPAYFVGLYGWLTKRAPFVIVAGILVVCHIWWTIPQFVPATAVPDAARQAPKLRLLSHNILWDNKSIDLINDEIVRHDADVVFLQEFSQQNFHALRDTAAYKKYPYRFVVPGGVGGLAMWSKTPLEQNETLESPGLPSQRAVTAFKGTEVILWNIHIASPPGGGHEYWRHDMTTLKQRLHQETGHVIAAGDFNATWTNGRYQDLLTKGYSDAHVSRGRGYARTWPANDALLSRFDGIMRIDHVVTSRNVVPTKIDEGAGNGSDHRSVIATLALL